MIALRDADNQSALQYVKAKLDDVGIDVQFSLEETEMIDCLGGRASDLATVRHDFACSNHLGLTRTAYSLYTKCVSGRNPQRQLRTLSDKVSPSCANARLVKMRMTRVPCHGAESRHGRSCTRSHAEILYPIMRR